MGGTVYVYYVKRNKVWDGYEYITLLI